MKPIPLYAALLTLAAASFPTADAAGAQPAQPQPPRLLDAREQRNTQRPGRQQRVAVLKLRIATSNGEVEEVEVRSVEVIESVAPKVFARRGGDWRVSIQGRRSVSYTINNPAQDIEIERGEDEDPPYSAVRPSGALDWTLVVPLYKDGRDLGARGVEITDLETGRTWARVPLRDAGPGRGNP